MRKRRFLILFLIFFSLACQKHEQADKLGPQNSAADSTGVYRYYWGEKDGFKVWVVDGAVIRKKIFNEFVYGGNNQRYPFVPEEEIWIDNSISAEEFETTLAHELNERNLMAKFGMTYYDAHDSSLALEVVMRTNWQKICAGHEASLQEVSPTDFDSTQEIETLPELIKLKNIYRVPLGERNGVKIWVVDGYVVRRDIYPDFGFSGNDRAYHFIPTNEIWVDGQVTCEETEYSIAVEMKERELMLNGRSYDDAYEEAVRVSDSMRIQQKKLDMSQPPLKIFDPPYRDTGTGTEK